MSKQKKHPPTPKRARIVDVANAAGVSTATVSRALTGSGRVGPELMQRIEEAVVATNYVPDSVGRALRRQRSDLWAVIVSDIRNPYFVELISAIEEVASLEDQSLVLYNTDELQVRERRFIGSAVAQRMSGVIIAVASEQDSDLSALEEAEIPTIVVDRRVQGFSGDSVVLDNIQAGKLAAEHLLKLGHTRILGLFGPSAASTTFDRYIGFKAAYENSQNRNYGTSSLLTDIRADQAQAVTAHALRGGLRPTAIYAANGALSAGAYRAVQASGLRVPEDISILGTDDTPWATMVRPALSVITQPVAEMGKVAAERLVKRNQNPEVEPLHLVLSPELVIRETTGPIHQ
ncbi:LacI family DNA-binding transcriptional regulator [Scrofimicrobium sp. R131]|uniref:LacI family DNA-binding transcriptional regulator n=1 Tax=Scrofimicrobium appendicitidis TaxID=3079930 RepID=A0AAU7V7D2_9ACTO